MTKYLIIIIMCCSSIITAQHLDDDQHDSQRQKIHALAVAYVTEQLELTPQESSQLWPILNKLRSTRHQLNRQKKQLIQDLDKTYLSLNDQQAQQYVDQLTRIEQQIHQSRYQNHSNDIIQIIGARRYLKLIKSEMDFHQKMFKEYRKRKNKTP